MSDEFEDYIEVDVCFIVPNLLAVFEVFDYAHFVWSKASGGCRNACASPKMTVYSVKLVNVHLIVSGKNDRSMHEGALDVGLIDHGK